MNFKIRIGKDILVLKGQDEELQGWTRFWNSLFSLLFFLAGGAWFMLGIFLGVFPSIWCKIGLALYIIVSGIAVYLLIKK